MSERVDSALSERQSEYQACPVCQGRGVVPHGFYNTSPAFGSTSTADEQCRTCRGRTIIQRPDDQRIEILRAMTVNPLRNARRGLTAADPEDYLGVIVEQLEALNKQATEWAT
jgi:Ribonuclease G/E